MSQLAKGAIAPDFELNNVDGGTFRLQDLLSRGPVVLAFYKASCPTCQLTFPYLQRIQGKDSSSGLKIVGISQDETEETRSFGAKLGLTFDVVIDEHPYIVSSSYGIETVPAIFVIEPDSRIGLSDFGFSKATLTQIAAKVAGSDGVPVPLFHQDDKLPATRPG